MTHSLVCLITITCLCREIFSSINCDLLKVSKVGCGLTVLIFFLTPQLPLIQSQPVGPVWLYTVSTNQPKCGFEHVNKTEAGENETPSATPAPFCCHSGCRPSPTALPSPPLPGQRSPGQEGQEVGDHRRCCPVWSWLGNQLHRTFQRFANFPLLKFLLLPF